MNIDPELLGRLLDATNASIVAVDREGLVTYWSRGSEVLYGYPAQEAIGAQLRDLIFGPGAEARSAEIRATIAAGRIWSGEFEAVRRDGGRVVVQLSAGRLLDDSGQPAGLVGVMVDVTGRVRAAEALRREQELLRSIIDNAPVVLFATDRSGIFTISRGRGLVALGLREGEVVGRSAFDVYRQLVLSIGDEQVAWPEVLSRVIAGEAIQARTIASGAHFDLWMAPTRDGNGRPSGAIGAALDVTERHALEQRVRQAERLEALGLLAGGVAHDFNNLLTAILGHADILLAELRDESLRPDALAIAHAAESAASVTGQLLAFTRRQRQELAPIDVNASVLALEQLLRRTLGERVALTLRLSPEPCTVVADAAQIEQVILNLAINARDAMPQGGTLTISTAIVGEEGTRVAEMAVADTGFGMSQATRERIFEPFFTTKERGRGTGLGLASVHGIVTQTGGHIAVESEEGHGTVFRVRLPCASPRDARELAVPPPETAAAPLFDRTQSVMVVEDEESLRRLISSMLARAGYRVDVEADPAVALARVRAHPEAYDLVLSDIVMPEMSGEELSREIARVRPSLPVVLMSGYADTVDAAIRPDIEKPFTREQLLNIIARRLRR